MSHQRVFFALLTALTGPIVFGQAPTAPRFRHERAVQVSNSGPNRLEVDLPLLAGSKLDDLRFYDPSGREVAYLLVRPPAGERQWHTARVLPVAETKKTSGFEADLGEAIDVDAIRVAGINAPFLKRLVLEGSGDRERWTMLASEGTLFDLPDERIEQTIVAFTPGPYRYLRVTWDDTNSGRVGMPREVTARRISQPNAPASTLRAPLVVERRPSEPGVSRFRIGLPAAGLPIVELDLTIGGGHLLREARVTEARLTGDQAAADTIGRATLRRVVRDGMTAETLRIPISHPREAQLDLVVDDGSNGPLDLVGVTAVFAELPWIYFEHEAGTLTARYGDARLGAPRYDLEAARSKATTSLVSSARWGDATSIAAPDEDPGLPMPEAGAALPAEGFKYSRTIAAGSGLTMVPLDAAVLAHSGSLRNSFADVRVLDQTGHQVPYLLERRDEPLAFDVRVEQRDLPTPLRNRYQGRTSYVVQLPYGRLPGARLALHTRARVFRRGVTSALLIPPVERRREPALDEMSTALWQHSNPDAPALALVFDVPETRRGDLMLIVDEGDNQPLPIEKATLLLPSYAIRLYRPAGGSLRLLYGRDDLAAPRYDLALLAPRVFGSKAGEVHPGHENAEATPVSVATIVSPPVFWAALGLAVLVLLGLIVRLVRREQGAGST